MEDKIRIAKEKQAQKLAELEKAKQSIKEKTKEVESKPKKSDDESASNPKKKKNNSVIEIDFGVLEKLIAENHSIDNPNEHTLFKYFFEPYEKNKGRKTIRGRNAFLWDAMKEVITKNAKSIVKRVTREDVD